MKPVEKLETMEQGDTLTGQPLFAGMIDAPVQVTVRSNSDKGLRTLDISFLGVKLAAAVAKPYEGKIIWAELD